LAKEAKMDTTKTTVFVAAVAALFGAIACGGEDESTTTVQRQDPLPSGSS
jgi:hypothetical protein